MSRIPCIALMLLVLLSTLYLPPAHAATPAPHRTASDLKKFKVTLSKSTESTNRTVYIDAKDSSDARQTAKDQNPGWQVELVTEVK